MNKHKIKLSDLYWFSTEEGMVLPFIFNRNLTKIKLLSEQPVVLSIDYIRVDNYNKCRIAENEIKMHFDIPFYTKSSCGSSYTELGRIVPAANIIQCISNPLLRKVRHAILNPEQYICPDVYVERLKASPSQIKQLTTDFQNILEKMERQKSKAKKAQTPTKREQKIMKDYHDQFEF